MSETPAKNALSESVAIACGGTGGHLFPGVAVGEELRLRGCDVTLMVSPKEVDQQAIRSISGMDMVTLPAVGLSRGGRMSFLWGFWKSYRLARLYFRRRRPKCVLAMGGFMSAPPVFAGRNCGAKTFLHESNSIPGRANRWLAPWVDGAFVYFPPAMAQLRARRVEVAGMPVRPQFRTPLMPVQARQALGLAVDAPVLLVMGGSQGAAKINELILNIVPQLHQAVPALQFMHLTGPGDFEKVRAGYAAQNVPALVRAFFDEMGTALAAADVAVSRAGASSLAELAARRVPAVLIPYPAAADNHQYFNARAFVQSGAAWMLQQDTATGSQLAGEILELVRDTLKRSAMQRALAAWHTPGAAAEIAEKILNWGADSEQSARAAALKLKTPRIGVSNC
ncbi:MAG TPA: undecaprenyldiphospho-muramoylpentapeptide beta-N-acetylglucosaminyltransferase [Candidatus Baltobacteraceae bacterium]|jgi:UDP-N-acetylglucosamine--N-acetylmuramyl-(pentapeptide) pyrophosphoryl-undecaprenol N-acetylglucosamine transferase|nr:undecaprenyldiphospho-muramoylpentapeptide beta-N-acetylglucosaminyltransferase [Candidatus Baltobacteraceae bacterium]